MHSAGGNNENEAAFDWFAAPITNPRLYAADFSKLFVDVVRQVGGWVGAAGGWVGVWVGWTCIALGVFVGRWSCLAILKHSGPRPAVCLAYLPCPALQAVLSVDPRAPYVDTSPSNGLFSSEPYAKRCAYVRPTAAAAHCRCCTLTPVHTAAAQKLSCVQVGRCHRPPVWRRPLLQLWGGCL